MQIMWRKFFAEAQKNLALLGAQWQTGPVPRHSTCFSNPEWLMLTCGSFLLTSTSASSKPFASPGCWDSYQTLYVKWKSCKSWFLPARDKLVNWECAFKNGSRRDKAANFDNEQIRSNPETVSFAYHSAPAVFLFGFCVNFRNRKTQRAKWVDWNNATSQRLTIGCFLAGGKRLLPNECLLSCRQESRGELRQSSR